jgi:hypothetical protein|tara:strand:- start:2422 stop:2661 length:240 start_codon:yes stop_codon:yes gene_type:complete
MNEDRKNVIYDFSAIKSARKSWITKAEEGPKTTKNQNRVIAAKEGVQRAKETLIILVGLGLFAVLVAIAIRLVIYQPMF